MAWYPFKTDMLRQSIYFTFYLLPYFVPRVGYSVTFSELPPINIYEQRIAKMYDILLFLFHCNI